MFATMTAPISDLLPYIETHVTTVPTPFAEFQARLAAIEFCERTRCWRQIINVSLNCQGRARVTALGATIHEFEEAALDGVPLIPSQFTEADPEEISGGENRGQAKYITQITPGEISVYPIQEGKLRLSCFLKPRHGRSIGTDATAPLDDEYNVLPAFMVTQYAEKLAHGALYRIMSTPKQDFTDMAMAAVHKQMFDQACDSHFSSNMRGQQRAPMRVKPRWL